MSEQITKKLGELADIITVVQEKNTKIEAKYDGLLNEEIKTLSEKASNIAADFDKINKERLEEKNRIDELEKLIARGAAGAKESKSDAELYDAGIMSYLRKGVHMDSEIAKKGLMGCLRTPGFSEQELEQKTMQVGINPDGGYWVQPDRLSTMVTRNFETSPMRSLATAVTTASDHIEMMIDDDEVEVESATEISTRNTTDGAQIGLLNIYTHEIAAEPKITQKLLDDAGFDVGSWLQRKINSKITRTENTRFVSGDGVNKAKGILSYSPWAVAGTYERNKLEQVVSGSAAAVTADGAISLQNSLQEIYQNGASWMMRRQTWGEYIKLKEGTTGAYLIDPTMLRNGAGRLLLLGNPVYFASDMPAVAAGALSVAYGDFSIGYHIVDKIGVILIRDNITDKGRVKFYTSKRTGGAVTNYEAIKIQEISA